MSGFLRQSTASQARALGPFVSDSDFKTVQTGLTIANTDIKLVINGGASANKNSGGGTHRVNGVYGVTFDATDTATVGEMQVSVAVSGALIVFDKFFVLEEAVYDALYAASAPGYLQPTTAGRTLDVAATGEAGLDFDNIHDASGAHTLTNIRVPTVTLTDTLTTYTSNTPQTGDAYARLGAPTGASVSADVATLLARVGAFTGSGLNTVLGFLRAIMRKDAALTPSDVGGTFDNTTDSLEALAESGFGTALTATHSLPAQGTLPDPVSLQDAILYNYKGVRNGWRVTSTTHEILADDDTTVDHKATLTADETQALRTKLVSGP